MSDTARIGRASLEFRFLFVAAVCAALTIAPARTTGAKRTTKPPADSRKKKPPADKSKKKPPAGKGKKARPKLVGQKPGEATFTPGQEVRVEMPKAGSFVLVYVPQDYTPERAWPVVLFYPGAGGKPTTRALQKITGSKGFIILGMKYATEDYRQGLGYTKTGPEKMYLTEALKIVEQGLKLDRRMIFMGGFSQGGYSTSILGEQLLGQLAGLIILGGGRSCRERHPPDAKLIRGKPVFLGAGAKDEVHRPRARFAVNIYKGWGADVTYEEWPDVGHKMETTSTKLLEWLRTHGPLKFLKVDLAAARTLEKAGKLGAAYATYTKVAALSDTDESCRAAGKAAQALGAKAGEQLAQAQQAVDDARYAEAVKQLATTGDAYEGCEFGRRARDRLDKLTADPKIRGKIAQATVDAKADALEARAAAATRTEDYARAISLYEQYLRSFPKATRFKKVADRLAALKADKTIQNKVDSERAAGECKKWLGMASSYTHSGMPDKARPYLRRVIEKYPKTQWAVEAQQRLDKLPGG